MTTQSFHLFSQLPPELRLQIWGHAVRDQNSPRRIHYLKVSKRHGCNDLTVESKLAGTNIKHEPPRFPTIPPWVRISEDRKKLLKEPPRPPKISNILSQHSWTQGDGKIQMEDAGLWTACRESRAVILQRTRPWCDAMAQFMMDGEIRFFTVRPYSDLFCFDPVDLSTAITWDVLLANLPFYKLRKQGRSLVRGPGLVEIDHIAFEFDAAWLKEPSFFWGVLRNEPTPRGFFCRTIEHLELNGPPCKVYLIDRTIGQDSRISPDGSHRIPLYMRTEPRAAFQDSQHTYLEVDIGDVIHVGQERRRPSDLVPNPFGFISHVIQTGDFYHWGRDQTTSWRFCMRRDVRVLRCVPTAEGFDCPQPGSEIPATKA